MNGNQNGNCCAKSVGLDNFQYAIQQETVFCLVDIGHYNDLSGYGPDRILFFEES